MSSEENYYSKEAGHRLGCLSLRGNSDKENVKNLFSLGYYLECQQNSNPTWAV